MYPVDFCELSIEQEEYLVELLCTRGACLVDLMARELDEACRANAGYSSTSPSSVADCASSSSLSLK
jgi:hypothetical protein